MIKKLATAGVTTALLLSSAVGAFAFGGHHGSSVSVENEDTSVITTTNTVANTGLNFTGGHSHHHGGTSVTTGDAVALSQVGVSANYTEVGCGCVGGGHHGSSVSVENEDTSVITTTNTVANSGVNFTNRGRVTTGNASAGSVVVADVNTTVIGSSN